MKTMTFIVRAVITFLLLLVAKSFVAMKLWEWFISDLTGVPTLPYLNTMGIILLITLLTPFKKRKKNAVLHFLAVITSWAMQLGIGYVIHLFM